MPQPAPTNPGVDTPDPPVPPRPSRFARLGAPFRRPWRWFVHQPRTIQVGLVLVVVAAGAAGGAYGWFHLKKRATDREVAAGWQDYREAVTRRDINAIDAALDRVLAARPDNQAAARYKAILDRGEADPDTPELAAVLMHDHLKTRRPAEAAREAEKVLAKNPKDWLARCVLAQHALVVHKDRALAEEHLNLLPDPEDPAAGLNANGLHYALQLSAAVGRDPGTLRWVIVRRLLPLLRSAHVASAPPGPKAQLLECYLEPFADPGLLAELAGYWAVADQLAESAVNEATGGDDVTVLVRVAALGPWMRSALATLRAHSPASLPEDRFNALARAIDDRTRRAWQAVRQKAPDRIDGYRGLAVLAIQGNDLREAVQQLFDGLEACGDRPELFDLLIPLVAREGTSEDVLSVARRVWEAAEAAKTDPMKWCLAANAAFAVNRPDEALAACQRAREINPKHPWACATEARIWLRAGNPVRAREALTPLGEAALRTNPALARLHGRAMAGSGLGVLLDGELKAIVEAQAALRPKTSAPAVAFLLGVFDAEPDVERCEWVVSQVTRILADDPAAPRARRLQAEALFRLAELTVTPNPKADGSPPVWNPDRVERALRAFEQLPVEERTDVGVIAAVAVLQLKGQGMKAAALRTITPLLPHEAALAPAQLEVLGAVLTANDRAAEAVRILERAVRLPGAGAGCRVALALAYRKNNQPIDARGALNKAFEVTGASEREHAERVAAKILFQRENP